MLIDFINSIVLFVHLSLFEQTKQVISDKTVANIYEKVIRLNKKLVTKMKVENIQSQLKIHSIQHYAILTIDMMST